MLTGAARRGAASFGSLLIAAVPSSPIERATVFLLAPLSGAVEGVGRLAAEVLGQARLACLLLGWFFGGAASDGCFRRSHVYRREFEMSVGLQ